MNVSDRPKSSSAPPAATCENLWAEAADAYREALEIYTRDTLPHYWALAQTALAETLRNQATSAQGQARARLLREAVVGYRAALEVESENTSPQAWATIQTHLANTLRLLSIRNTVDERHHDEQRRNCGQQMRYRNPMSPLEER